MRLRKVCLLISTFVFAVSAWAQSGAGSLSGTVLDPAGAVIPGVKVKVHEDATGRDLEMVTSEAGAFVFPVLQVGTYTISAEASGFKKLIRGNIVIATANRTAVELKMEVGTVSEAVEVRDEAPLLSTATSDTGTNFQPKFMKDAPLFVGGGFRNVESFIAYMPGVNNGTQDSSINGGPRRGKEILIDGASHTNPESGGVSFVSNGGLGSVDQFGEFRLINGNFSAEYGKTAGGIEVFVTKSGGNVYHGGVFDYIRNDAFDAAGWSINRQRRFPDGDTRNPKKAKVRQHEYGLNFGGPVWIPKLYNGRNRTFFHFTNNYYRQSNAVVTGVGTVGTQLMKQGNFTELGSKLIYDPATGANRTPFASNTIPASRFSSVSRNVLPLIPNPTSAGIAGNLSFTNFGSRDLDIWSVKVDHSFNDRNRVSFFYSDQNITQLSEAGIPGPLAQGLSTADTPRTWRGSYDRNITPTMLNHFRFGLSRYDNDFDQLPQHKNAWPEKLGLKGVATDGASSFPIVGFTDGLTQFGNDPKNRGNQTNITYTFSDTLSKLQGRHELKFGFEYRRGRTFQIPLDEAYAHGRFNFANFQTSGGGALRGTTGFAFASFLLGGPDSARRDYGTKGVDILYTYNAAFVQDNIRVNQKLTLNLGVRYELFHPRYDRNFTQSNFDPAVPNPGAGNRQGAMVFLGDGPGRNGQKRFGKVYKGNFGPRLGLAYQIDSKTVLRGGWGINYSAANGNTGGGCFPCGWGTSFSSNPLSLDGLSSVFNWDAGFSPGPPRPLPFIDPAIANGQSVLILTEEDGLPGRIQSWSVNIQRELPGSWLLDVAYVGMKSVHLNTATPFNQVNPSQLSRFGDLLTARFNDPRVTALNVPRPYAGFNENQTLAQALRPYPQFLNITHTYLGNGSSNYNALQAKVERRYKALNVLVGYTWSRTLAFVGAETQTGSGVAVQDQYNLGNEKSLQRFDIPHTLNLIYTYDLPFGKGASGFKRALVGGWTVSGLHQYRSGTLLQPAFPNTLAAYLFNPALRVNLTGQAKRSGQDRTSLDPGDPNSKWFNIDAFSTPRAGEFGTAAAYFNDFRTPPIFSENFSLVKRTVFLARGDHRMDVELRADASNIFNRTLFGAVNTNLADRANFGRPQGVQIGPRFIQMGIKVNF